MMYSKKFVDKLKNDIDDLLLVGDFERCGNCNRYNLSMYKCQFCGFDNSVDTKRDFRKQIKEGVK